MFDRFKSLVQKSGNVADRATSVADWAKSAGLTYHDRGAGQFGIEGRHGKHPWVLELGPTSRDFIHGDQLRGRISVEADPSVTVVVMNRALKDALDERVYALYTDSVQTVVSPDMTDEMRWVTIFEEFGWDSLPLEFWQRYSVIADRRAHAPMLVNEDLADVLMNWPDQRPDQATPFTLNFSRSKIYLRMEYRPADLATVQYAATVLLTAGEVAAAGFPPPPPA